MAGQQSNNDSAIPAPFKPPQLGRSSCAFDAAYSNAFQDIPRFGGRKESPLFIIDSHPVDVCRPIRKGDKERLSGLVQTGYCASLKRWFHGVREHLIFSPEGRIAFALQIPGNRHDVNGLYELLKTSFQGHLLGDTAYWPKPKKRSQLAEQGVTVTAATRKGWFVKNPIKEQRLLDAWRGSVERRFGLFNAQFHAGRTLCRSLKHYHARRWTKILAHNVSRHLNVELNKPIESVMHYQLAA